MSYKFSQNIGQPVSKTEDGAAEQQKVKTAPQHHTGQQVKTDIPVPRRYGIEKKGGYRQWPIEEV